MNTNIQKLSEILLELRNASIRIMNDAEVKSVMHKYDMLFLGSKFNTIYSVELHHSLTKIFKLDITMTELNSLIPTVCNMLNMSFEELIAVEDIGKPNPAISYQIILWK